MTTNMVVSFQTSGRLMKISLLSYPCAQIQEKNQIQQNQINERHSEEAGGDKYAF